MSQKLLYVMMLFRQSQTFRNFIFVLKESRSRFRSFYSPKNNRERVTRRCLRKSWKQSFMPFCWSCLCLLAFNFVSFWRAFWCRRSSEEIESPKKLLVSWYNTCKMPLLILRAINSELISSETMRSFSHFKLNRINCFFDKFQVFVKKHKFNQFNDFTETVYPN